MRTVAFTYDQVPGSDSGEGFWAFDGNVSLNDKGEVAFIATFGRPGESGTAGTGVYTDKGAGVLREVARTGIDTPGLPDGTYFGKGPSFSFSRPNLNNAGHLSFGATLAGEAVTLENKHALILDTGLPTLNMIAREGDSVPGSPDVRDERLLSGQLLVNDGTVAFAASVTRPGDTSTSGSTVFIERAGQPHQVLIGTGEVFPGALPSDSIKRFSGISLNELGVVAVELDLGRLDSTERAILVREHNSPTRVVARTGDAAVGMDSGLTYQSLSRFGINSRGEVVFASIVSGFDEPRPDRSAITVASPDGNASVLAVEDDPAPVPEAGLVYESLERYSNWTAINSAGEVAYTAELAGPPGETPRSWAVFKYSDESIEAVARSGDRFVNRPAAQFHRAYSNVSLNAAGQVAIPALWREPGARPTGGQGIVGTDRNGQLRAVALAGDYINVSDDPSSPAYRRLETVRFAGTGGDDGRATGINDLGQVAFIGEFSDGSSGVFVSNVLTVPETATATLIAPATLCGLLGRQRAAGVAFD